MLQSARTASGKQYLKMAAKRARCSWLYESWDPLSAVPARKEGVKTSKSPFQFSLRFSTHSAVLRLLTGLRLLRVTEWGRSW